jgi:hypothetical protein
MGRVDAIHLIVDGSVSAADRGAPIGVFGPRRGRVLGVAHRRGVETVISLRQRARSDRRRRQMESWPDRLPVIGAFSTAFALR